MDLHILSDLESKMLFIVQCLTGHDGLGAQCFRHSALQGKEVEQLNCIEHNVYHQQHRDSVKWHAVTDGSGTFLDDPDTSLRLGNVFVGACKVHGWCTWQGFNQEFEGFKLIVSMDHGDAEATLQVVCVDFLESAKDLHHLPGWRGD
jgi:hypothetical protein